MITKDSIKKITDLKIYLKGLEHYRNKRVFEFERNDAEDGIVWAAAAFDPPDNCKAQVTADRGTGEVVSWSCTCKENNDAMCAHTAAVGLSLSMNQERATGVYEDFGSAEKSVLQELGFSKPGLAGKNCLNDRIAAVFTAFNMGQRGRFYGRNDLPAAGDLRFSLKISDMSDSGRSLVIDRDLIRKTDGQLSLFLEYISCNSVFSSGEYILGQLCVDTTLSLAAGLDHVMYGNTDQRISITKDRYVPSIMTVSAPDGSMAVIAGNSPVLIPGKYSQYILVDKKIMKLSEDIPPAFMYKLSKKITLNPAKTDIALNSVFPMLNREFDIAAVPVEDNGSGGMEIVPPEVNIYIVQDIDSELIYIRPEIRYGRYLRINPFSAERLSEFSNFYLAEPKIKTLVKVKNNDSFFFFRRELKTEYSVYRYFLRYPEIKNAGDGRLLAGHPCDTAKLFCAVIPDFPDNWKVFYDKSIEKLKPVQGNVDFDLLTDSGNGLLEFNVEFHCGEMKISIEALLEYLRSNSRLLFNNGRFVEVKNDEQLRALLELLTTFDLKDGNVFSDRLYRIRDISPYLKPETEIQQGYDQRTAALLKEMQDGAPLEEIEIPDVFKNVLRHYQTQGVQWMHFLRKYGFGGVLADDMGLGKTLQSLVMVSAYSKDRSSLVVCPKTLIYNWAAEAEKFDPGIAVTIVQGSRSERKRLIKSNSGKGLIITSYPLLQRDLALYEHMEFEYCIIDEAQKIKNPDTQNARCVKKISAAHKLALTGTPLENALTDLWSVFDFAMPGFLGNEKEFRERYCDVSSEKQREEIKNLSFRIKPFLLRRTKQEILDELPPKIEQVAFAQLTKAQLLLYSDMLEKIKKDAFRLVAENGFENSRIMILAGLTRLRQICNHPGLINENLLDHEEISGKTELFDELVDECVEGGHRVLVFSQFVKMLDILQDRLEQRGIRTSRLDGTTRKRQEVVDGFNNTGDAQIFLISLKAGGVGLNITSADTVIIYDPWWNPMAEDQAADRAHRIGQKKSVNVYRLITRGTIEEKIQRLQRKKRDLFNSVINESGEYISRMTWEDIKEIIAD